MNAGARTVCERGSGADPRREGGTQGGPGARDNAPAPIEGREGEPEDDPAEAGPARRRILDHDHEPGEPGAEPAEDGEERPVDPAPAQVRAGAEDELLLPAAGTEGDDRGVRDRERQGRAE